LHVFYYHYFLYFNKAIKDADPHLRTCLALGASESFLLSGIIQIVSVKYFCYYVDYRILFGIAVVLCAINCWYYMMKRKGEEVIEKKPLFFESKRLSVTLTIIFFIITISYLFWGAIYLEYLLENCRGE